MLKRLRIEQIHSKFLMFSAPDLNWIPYLLILEVQAEQQDRGKGLQKSYQFNI